MPSAESLNTEAPANRPIQSMLVARVIATWTRVITMALAYQPGAFGSSRPGRARSSAKKNTAAASVTTVGRARFRARFMLSPGLWLALVARPRPLVHAEPIG